MGEKIGEKSCEPIRCFSEDCINFKKHGWTYGGQCTLPSVAISSGTGACLNRVLRTAVEKPDCYYRVGVETGQCAVCEWFKECPMQGHGKKVKPPWNDNFPKYLAEKAKPMPKEASDD